MTLLRCQPNLMEGTHSLPCEAFGPQFMETDTTQCGSVTCRDFSPGTYQGALLAVVPITEVEDPFISGPMPPFTVLPPPTALGVSTTAHFTHHALLDIPLACVPPTATQQHLSFLVYNMGY